MNNEENKLSYENARKNYRTYQGILTVKRLLKIITEQNLYDYTIKINSTYFKRGFFHDYLRVVVNNENKEIILE